MIDRNLADKMYAQAIEDLAGAIRGFIIPGRVKANGEAYTDGSVKGFCEHFGIDRANLQRSFSQNGKDLGVGTFMRCGKALGLKSFKCEDLETLEAEPGLFNLSLRHFLLISSGNIKDAIIELNYL